jgi:hypothetical protein
MALPSTSGYLGAFDLRHFQGRHASSGSAGLLAAMQNIWVSLHSIRSRSTLFGKLHYWQHAFEDLARYPRILNIVYLRPHRGRLAYKAYMMSALPDSLQPWGLSLHSIKTTNQFSFFEHQTSHAACFNARGLFYECVFDALLFSSSYRPVGKPFSHHVVTRPTLSSFSFLDHHIRHPAHHDARILLYECILDTLWIFFIVVLIYRKPTSYRSSLDLSSFGKTVTSTRLLACGCLPRQPKDGWRGSVDVVPSHDDESVASGHEPTWIRPLRPSGVQLLHSW